VRGEELLTLHRVREKTHTDRLVASCCNSAMTQVHHNWWPHRGVKTERIVGACPPIEMRIFTRHAPEPRALPRDVPSHATVSPAFAAMLVREALAVRLKTLFRR
jgi:hypothetical protein